MKRKVHSNITFSKQSGNTRSSVSGKLTKPFSRTISGKKRISSYAVNIFNDLKDDVKNLPHVYAFKWALKCSIRNEEFIALCHKKFINI